MATLGEINSGRLREAGRVIEVTKDNKKAIIGTNWPPNRRGRLIGGRLKRVRRISEGGRNSYILKKDWNEIHFQLDFDIFSSGAISTMELSDSAPLLADLLTAMIDIRKTYLRIKSKVTKDNEITHLKKNQNTVQLLIQSPNGGFSIAFNCSKRPTPLKRPLFISPRVVELYTVIKRSLDTRAIQAIRLLRLWKTDLVLLSTVWINKRGSSE